MSINLIPLVWLAAVAAFSAWQLVRGVRAFRSGIAPYYFGRMYDRNQDFLGFWFVAGGHIAGAILGAVLFILVVVLVYQPL